MVGVLGSGWPQGGEGLLGMWLVALVVGEHWGYWGCRDSEGVDMEVQWRFGDTRDLGTWRTHSGSQMGAMGHVPPVPNTQGQVLTQGPVVMGITPWSRELVPW